MNKRIVITAITAICVANITTTLAQFKVVNECYPQTTKSIEGIKTFEREKYVNIGASSNAAQSTLSPQQESYYFKVLDMHFGRNLGMVYPAYQWGKSVREDANRPGYADLEYLKLKSKADDSKLDAYKGYFGANESIALHDKHNTYPDFMPSYQIDGSKERFPQNNDAAGELAANILKYGFTDFTRPKYYEPVNEPDWRYWKDERFAKHHLDIKHHVEALGLDVMVGGPCFSVSNFYNKEYQSLKSVTNFMDMTEHKLDFYSFHSYDYFKWSSENKRFEGAMNSGSALEGVMDAIASYSHNKFGKQFKYVASEHGGYHMKDENCEKVEELQKGKPVAKQSFKEEMDRRKASNFLMHSGAMSNTFTYMNIPHIVLKTVPFILLETAKWDTKYYSALLVKDGFNKQSTTWIESPLIYFYEYFKDVKGDRVRSWCNSTDIQHHAFRDGNTLILLYHNQSNKDGVIDLQLKEFGGDAKDATIRRVGRDKELKIFYNETKCKDLSNITISGQESVAIFVKMKGDAAIKKSLDEKIFYATEQGVQFKGARTFTLNLPANQKFEDAFLHIGINRKNCETDGISIKINGKIFNSKTEHAAERFTTDNGYTTTRVVRIPTELLKTTNSVEVCFADGESGGVGAVTLRGLN